MFPKVEFPSEAITTGLYFVHNDEVYIHSENQFELQSILCVLSLSKSLPVIENLWFIDVSNVQILLSSFWLTSVNYLGFGDGHYGIMIGVLSFSKSLSVCS